MVYFKLSSKYVYFHTSFLKSTDDFHVISQLRKEFPDSFIQGVNFDVIYNYEHICEILKISTLAEKRKTMCSNKIELDFLLRIVGTNQITQAINEGGLKTNIHIVFVVLAYKIQINNIKQKINILFGNSNEEIFFNKKILKDKIEKFQMKFNNKYLEEKDIIKFLREIGALINK